MVDSPTRHLIYEPCNIVSAKRPAFFILAVDIFALKFTGAVVEAFCAVKVFVFLFEEYRRGWQESFNFSLLVGFRFLERRSSGRVGEAGSVVAKKSAGAWEMLATRFDF